MACRLEQKSPEVCGENGQKITSLDLAANKYLNEFTENRQQKEAVIRWGCDVVAL